MVLLLNQQMSHHLLVPIPRRCYQNPPVDLSKLATVDKTARKLTISPTDFISPVNIENWGVSRWLRDGRMTGNETGPVPASTAVIVINYPFPVHDDVKIQLESSAL